jgi:hypothetical protein
VIVLINPKQKTVTICDQDVKIYDINDLQSIHDEISNKEVIYVTEYIEAGGDEIVQLIEDNFLTQNYLGDQTEIENGILYLHNTKKTKMYINYMGKDYLFSGIYDFKCIDDLPENFVNNCRSVKDAIKSGDMEIINEYQKSQLEARKDVENIAKSKRHNKSVEKTLGDDPIEIDIGKASNFKRNRS